MIDPEKRADFLRKKLIRDKKYLIAKIAGERQAPGERKLLGIYFRYKDYIDPIINKNWFSATLDEIWSPKFLGLNENFFNQPPEKIKRLEFQNPPYSAAFRLEDKRRDPRKFTKVFTFQIAGCDFDCNYCYVPTQLKIGEVKFGRYFSAREIVNHFLEIKKNRKNEDWNVLRISGGEPLALVPELLLDIEKEILKGAPKIYIWIETNLSTLKYIKEFEEKLKKIFKKKNIGVVGCFKGVSPEDFSILTGADPKFYRNQFEVAKFLIDLGADIYFYLPALVYKNNIEEKVENFIKNLRKIHQNLPLRMELLPIFTDYPAAKVNIEEKTKLGRPMPEIDQKIIFDLWYKKLLSKFYSKRNLKKYCCQIKL